MRAVILLSLLIVLTVLSSCFARVKQIGKVNMISNRNIDYSVKYKPISTYSGASKRELRKSRAITLEDAVDQTVRKVPGGEYLMNAKIYLVSSKYIAVEGDVWGGGSGEISYRGFKNGDKVTWKNKKNLVTKLKRAKDYLTGTITALKDNEKCLVKIDGEEGHIIELSYDEITKSFN